jgi:prepilin-type N-terminal cleavage/methylation domain-containing protein
MLTRSRKAFTLLELIVVIVILGILALLAIPTFNAVINRAKDSNVENAARSLGREVAALAAFDNVAPTTSYATTAIGDLAGTGVTAVTTGTAGNYLVTKDSRNACLTLGTTVGGAGSVSVLGTATTPC